jgi:hypothetical protein
MLAVCYLEIVFPCYFLLKFLDSVICKFNDPAAFNADQMIVMLSSMHQLESRDLPAVE